MFLLLCCPKKKFWTKQKTITPPPPFKLNGRSLRDAILISSEYNLFETDVEWHFGKN